MNTDKNTNEKCQVVNFQNEDGFKDGFYIVEVNTDNHVIWHSVCFETRLEAITEMESL